MQQNAASPASIDHAPGPVSLFTARGAKAGRSASERSSRCPQRSERSSRYTCRDLSDLVARTKKNCRIDVSTCLPRCRPRVTVVYLLAAASLRHPSRVRSACGTPSRLLARFGWILVAVRACDLVASSGPEEGYFCAQCERLLSQRARGGAPWTRPRPHVAAAPRRREEPPKLPGSAPSPATAAGPAAPASETGWSRPRTGNSCSARRCASRSAGGRSILEARACWLPPLSSSRASTCSRGPDRAQVQARARRACSHSFRTH